MNIETRKTSDLKPLVAIKSIHRWDVDDAAFCTFRDDIAENGIKHPLQITKNNDIVDGMTRWTGARLLQLPEVPVVVVPDDQVDQIILRELVLRRNLTKSQMAYSMVPLIGPAFEGAKKRSFANLKKGQSSESNSVGIGRNGLLKRVKTPDEWAMEMGFSGELMRQAKWLHDQIDEWSEAYPWGSASEPITLKLWVESRLFDHDDPMSVGALNKAVGSLIDARKHPHKVTGGRPEDTSRQLDLFQQTVTDEFNRWTYWQKAPAETKKAHFEQIRAKALQLPAAQAKEMADYHARLAKEFEAAAKAAEKQAN